MITSLFYSCEKVVIIMNKWIIVRNFMKHHDLNMKILEDIAHQITCTQKKFKENLK